MEQMYICLAIFAIMVILFLSRKIPMAFSALIAMVLLIITHAVSFVNSSETLPVCRYDFAFYSKSICGFIQIVCLNNGKGIGL